MVSRQAVMATVRGSRRTAADMHRIIMDMLLVILVTARITMDTDSLRHLILCRSLAEWMTKYHLIDLQKQVDKNEEK